jgi:hypothetical protein
VCGRRRLSGLLFPVMDKREEKVWCQLKHTAFMYLFDGIFWGLKRKHNRKGSTTSTTKEIKRDLLRRLFPLSFPSFFSALTAVKKFAPKHQQLDSSAVFRPDF